MKDNIALIGMMGSGKTTVGLKLSEKLSMRYADTDELVEYEYAEIPKLFELFGEDGFRRYEGHVVKEVSGYSDTVISTGGGVVLNYDNMAYLNKSSIIVYLSVKPQTAAKRVKNSNRPLLKGNTEEMVKKILNERKALYEKYADITVKTDGKSPDKIADEIIEGITELYK